MSAPEIVSQGLTKQMLMALAEERGEPVSPELEKAMEDLVEARDGLTKAIQERDAMRVPQKGGGTRRRGHKPVTTPPAFNNVEAKNIRQAMRGVARGAPGKKNTPPVEVLYADLIKAGEVRIIRKKGRPPVVEWLNP